MLHGTQSKIAATSYIHAESCHGWHDYGMDERLDPLSIRRTDKRMNEQCYKDEEINGATHSLLQKHPSLCKEDYVSWYVCVSLGCC